ncbi:hypothetical protein RRG08_001080 [Elysia crispata]|uniref:Uncharacterized protein n=1 Tax=Elysia crispata TaxID=231223 RepID=A0AAE1AVW8_9GAST|nr:hypothetical protein RRG08_001080 [Elysia crispata]
MTGLVDTDIMSSLSDDKSPLSIFGSHVPKLHKATAHCHLDSSITLSIPLKAMPYRMHVQGQWVLAPLLFGDKVSKAKPKFEKQDRELYKVQPDCLDASSAVLANASLQHYSSAVPVLVSRPGDNTYNVPDTKFTSRRSSDGFARRVGQSQLRTPVSRTVHNSSRHQGRIGLVIEKD